MSNLCNHCGPGSFVLATVLSALQPSPLLAHKVTIVGCEFGIYGPIAKDAVIHIHSVTQERVIIGDAVMLYDRTIVVRLRRTADGRTASGTLQYPVGDANYKKILDHIGGLNPGQMKPFPAWTD